MSHSQPSANTRLRRTMRVRFAVLDQARVRIAARALDLTCSEAIRVAVQEWLARVEALHPDIRRSLYSREQGSRPGS